jgi:hypothetical protein
MRFQARTAQSGQLIVALRRGHFPGDAVVELLWPAIMYVSCESDSDTLKLHELAFAGSRDPYPGLACGRGGCSQVVALLLSVRRFGFCQ